MGAGSKEKLVDFSRNLSFASLRILKSTPSKMRHILHQKIFLLKNTEKYILWKNLYIYKMSFFYRIPFLWSPACLLPHTNPTFSFPLPIRQPTPPPCSPMQFQYVYPTNHLSLPIRPFWPDCLSSVRTLSTNPNCLSSVSTLTAYPRRQSRLPICLSSVPTLTAYSQCQPWLPILNANPDCLFSVPTLSAYPPCEPWLPILSVNPDCLSSAPTLSAYPPSQLWPTAYPSANPVCLSSVSTLTAYSQCQP
jgi:hypothetical protein